jgi:hypothetical protein
MSNVSEPAKLGINKWGKAIDSDPKGSWLGCVIVLLALLMVAAIVALALWGGQWYAIFQTAIYLVVFLAIVVSLKQCFRLAQVPAQRSQLVQVSVWLALTACGAFFRIGDMLVSPNKDYGVATDLWVYLALLACLELVQMQLRAAQKTSPSPSPPTDGSSQGPTGPGGLSEEVKTLANDPNKKIQAIALYREQTGAGLKEAKDAVEAYIAGRG